MDGVQLPQGYSHFEEAVYFLPLSSQKFLVLILPTSEGWKAESTLEPPSGFEHGTPGLGIQCLNHWAHIDITFELTSTITLILQAIRLTKCASVALTCFKFGISSYNCHKFPLRLFYTAMGIGGGIQQCCRKCCPMLVLGQQKMPS